MSWEFLRAKDYEADADMVKAMQKATQVLLKITPAVYKELCYFCLIKLGDGHGIFKYFEVMFGVLG